MIVRHSLNACELVTDLDRDSYHIIRTLKDANGYWTVTVNMVGHNPPNDLDIQHYVGDRSLEQRQQAWRDFARRYAE